MGNKYGGFPGGGMGNMQNLLKQAQKMQAERFTNVIFIY